MIYVGIDDTDTLETPGTNQLARAMASAVAAEWSCMRIVRHQLLQDPRVPCTSKNGSASLLFSGRAKGDLGSLIARLRDVMRERFVSGSDPGLCVTEHVPQSVIDFGRRCQRELVDQEAARSLAARHSIHLEGLGGTEGGVIGALAAIGLAATEDDGRVVQIDAWPDDLSGPQELAALHRRGVQVRRLADDREVASGRVDVGKHLRPNLRGGKIVLFVEGAEETDDVAWHAVRLL